MKVLGTVFFLFLMSISGLVGAMSIVSVGKSCVFSAVEIVLTKGGEPVVDAPVSRVSEWQKEETETTVTDENGRFSFPVLYHASASKFVPFSEFVASQSIVVTVEGEEYEIWANAKRDAKENSELGGKPLKLTCELNEEARLVEDFETLLVTNCRW